MKLSHSGSRVMPTLVFPAAQLRMMTRHLRKSMLPAGSRLAALAASLITAAIVLGAGAAIAAAGQSVPTPGLGSAKDYVKNNPDFPNASQVPLLGIEVNNGTDSLKGGHAVSGVEVLSAIPRGPGATAGLQGRREGVQTALTVGILAGAVFFPPAMLGVMALQQSGIGQSRELIIAVDGQRTRDVTDFGEAIEKAAAGEVVYLTVLSRGQREQVRVALPDRP
jgi:S1-C subfamily serine protease